MARQLTFEIAIEKARAQQDLRDLEQGMKNLEAAALKTGSATDKQAAAHENLSKRAAAAKDRIREMDAEQKKLVQSSEKAATTTDKQAKASGLLTSAVLKYVSAGAVIAAVKWTADWADRIEELSKSTGLSITMIQKLDQVTKQNGVTIETLTKAFAAMQDRVAGGDKSAVRAFEKLGLSFETFRQMRPDDQMVNLASAIMRIEDPMTRANVVTDLFGRTGVQLIPTLERIASGMDDITVASEKNIRAVGQLSDWYEQLKSTAAVLIVEALGPIVSAFEKSLFSMDGVIDRVALLRDQILQLNPILKFMYDHLPMNNIDYGPTPTAVNPEGYSGLPGASGSPLPLPNFDMAEALRIGKEITADVERQIAARTSNHTRVRETTTALREQLSVMEMQAQRLSDISTFFGYKPKNFEWENYNPLPPAPGAPGATGPNNYQQILGPYFGNVSGNNNPNMPSFWRRQGQQLSAAQANWRQQNFGSIEGWTNSAMDWGYMGQDIMENGDPLVNATNVRGRGKRALAGALKGAEVGGRFGGPYGAMGGALVGLIVGAFRNPAFEDVWNRIAKNFGVEVSDELAKSIADRAKNEFNNNRQAAEIASLGSIIQEGGGLNAGNIGQMTSRLHDAFSMFGTGAFTKKQLEDTLDSSFGYFAEYYENLGGLADNTFRRVIEMSREAGVESAAVTEYVNGQVMNAAAGLEQYLENATVKSQSAASGIGAAMVLMFDEIRRGPEGLRGAIDTLGPMILAFQEQMTAAGLTGGDAFQGMLDYVRAFEVEGVAQATTAVDGLNMTLEGLYNATLLNAESFTGLSRAMTDEIEVARQALIAQGQDGDKALQLNAAGLQTIWELQKQFGWAVDESTQAMLDQAEAQGLIGSEFQDTNKQMLDAMLAMTDVLRDIRDGMLGVGDAAQDAGQQIDDAFNRPRTVPVDFEYPDDPWNDMPGRPPDGYARGGVVRPRYAALGMFVPRGTDTVPAMLTPGEGVLSRRGMRMLGKLNDGDGVGAGTVMHITINANGRAEGDAAAEALVEGLRRRGVKLAGVA